VSTISRREARRAAVFMLFQWDVTSRPLGSLYEGDVDTYTRELADAVVEHATVLDGGRARADLQLAVAYGRVLPETATAVQERVADALERMCEVEVEAVDVTVEALERVE